MKKRLLIFFTPILLFILLLGSYIIYSHQNKPLFEGASEDGTWKVMMTKSDKTSIGPNEYLDVYWQGHKEEEKKTIVKKIILKVDGKMYRDGEDYELSDYTGEELDGGGSKPDHISTFDFIPEDEIKNHDLTVQIKWTDGHREQTANIKMKENN
ncbi:DUF4944 domain-containing protein [Bacillus changyiensis]|uniref:DUF4944 domain-containing protein n=1 Tax=Bacillus changyiensis TaxID=3004103 RepID=UPI0022E14023|nr:DUF4944 domain-containing protein [Bacillus changyiensis]MDA1477962.1 DUF4944 domain-containing protein [Bacillus changyiensis]